MTSVFHLINNKYSSLSRSERTVAEYILQNPAAVMLLSMRGLAEKINLSDNTVLRFCRTCGFSGYLDFKTALLPQVVTENGSIYKQVDTRDRFTLQREATSPPCRCLTARPTSTLPFFAPGSGNRSGTK